MSANSQSEIAQARGRRPRRCWHAKSADFWPSLIYKQCKELSAPVSKLMKLFILSKIYK